MEVFVKKKHDTLWGFVYFILFYVNTILMYETLIYLVTWFRILLIYMMLGYAMYGLLVMAHFLNYLQPPWFVISTRVLGTILVFFDFSLAT